MTPPALRIVPSRPEGRRSVHTSATPPPRRHLHIRSDVPRRPGPGSRGRFESDLDDVHDLPSAPGIAHTSFTTFPAIRERPGRRSRPSKRSGIDPDGVQGCLNRFGSDLGDVHDRLARFGSDLDNVHDLPSDSGATWTTFTTFQALGNRPPVRPVTGFSIRDRLRGSRSTGSSIPTRFRWTKSLCEGLANRKRQRDRWFCRSRFRRSPAKAGALPDLFYRGGAGTAAVTPRRSCPLTRSSPSSPDRWSGEVRWPRRASARCAGTRRTHFAPRRPRRPAAKAPKSSE
jgi:hypothetical protein